VRMTAIPTQIRRRKWPSVAWAGALAAGSLAVGLAGFAAAPAQALAASQPQRLAVSGSHPAWATGSADVGPVPRGTVITARVYLAGRDPAGMAAYATQVSDPGSALYGHYLTPAQYEQRFGPTGAQISAVRQWLTGAGLRVTAVTSHYVATSGTEAEDAAAFGTALRYYRVDGTVQRAPQAAVTVPDSAAGAVLTVLGLATSNAKITPDVATTSPVSAAGPVRSAASAADCSRYWGQDPATGLPPAYGKHRAYVLCGYVPHQLRTAYGVSGSGLTGKGVTIAIVDPGASPTIASDVNTYMRRHGEPVFRAGQFRQYLPSNLASSCGTELAPYGEEHLDIEAAHSMAPDADIAYVAADCTSLTDAVDAETEIVDGHLADIVSDSWHLGIESQMPAGLVPAFEQVFEQGAIEGIGFYFSSGDHGDWSPFTPNGQKAVQYPGSDPWVTSVGGTSLATSADGRYRWETGWGDDIAPLSANGKSWTNPPGTFAGGSGGGASELFTQPYYQRGIVPASLAGAAKPMRVMPDIAADADPATGMLIGLTEQQSASSPQEYTEVVVGGTSEACPLIAGIEADAEQALGMPIGFANPAIYLRYGTRAYHDVTDYPLGAGVQIAAVLSLAGAPAGEPPDALVTLAHDTSLRATRGYDDVTGVGSPTAAYLRSYRRRGV
jgi:subtilase family serine protease